MIKNTKEQLKQIVLQIGSFLKTDIRYVLKQGSWMAGGEIINNILSLALVVAFANLISVADYGVYKYILSIYGMFALFGLSGAGPAIIKTVAEGNENIFKPVIKEQIKWGLIGSFCLIIMAIYYFQKDNLLFSYGFFIAAAALPFFESFNTYQHILAGKKRFDLQIRYYSGTRIISSLSLILCLYLSNNILIILSAYFLPYIISNILFGTLALKKVSLNDKFEPNAIVYMKNLSFINAISFAVNYLDGIIIFQLLGPVQLAIYSIASAPSSKVQSFFSIIPDLSLPKYTERPIEEIRSNILSKIAKATVLCALIVIAYIFFVPFFFKWFLPQYINAVLFAQLFAVPLIWYPLALLPRVLLAKGATKFIYYNNLIGSFLQIIIMFFAVYFYGLIGAVIGRIIVSIVSYPIVYYYFRKL